MLTEQQQIRPDHPLYNLIDQFCFYSKELYNRANFVIRKDYFTHKDYKWIRYRKVDKMFQGTPEYKNLMSQASQCTLQVLDRNWKSFIEGKKAYDKDNSKFLGKPHPPKYKDYDGRFTWFLKNNQIYFENGYLWFKMRIFNGYKFHTHLTDKDRIVSIRFVPKGSIYVFEVVYEIEIPDALQGNSTRIASIDLGLNNFVTLTNNIGLRPIIINGKGAKSINQYYNKRRAELQSTLKIRNDIDWSKKLSAITLKRNNRIKNFVHHVSKAIVDWCVLNNIDTLVCGLNDTWKQDSNMGTRINQNFIQLPYRMLVDQLNYKCENNRIRFITNEESYTSGTSFLDDELPIKENYNKSRRVKRGLFKSNTGRYINSDVNGSLQIMRKVFPDAISATAIEGDLTPLVLNVIKFA
jgi:putative transposase